MCFPSRRRAWRLLLPASALLSLTLMISAGAASAADSDPDTTFGSAGVALSAFSAGNAAYRAAVALPDGTTLVAGSVANLGYVVQRLLPNGAVDPSFGMNGVAPGGVTETLSFINAMAVQSDGKIVIAGTLTPAGGGATRLFVERLSADGTPDTSFGSGGRFVLPSTPGLLASAATGDGVAIEPTGKIIAVGSLVQDSAGDTLPLVVQLNADGSPDTTFDAAGIPGYGAGPLQPAGTSDGWTGVAIDAQGRAVVVGGQHKVEVARIATSGTNSGHLDTTFAPSASTPGVMDVPTAGTHDVDAGTSIAIDSLGRIVVAGQDNPNGVIVARLTADGAMDSTFHPAGFNPGVVTDPLSASGSGFSAVPIVRGLVITPANLIDVAGSGTAGSFQSFFLARFTDGGLRDMTFNPASSVPEATTLETGDGGSDIATGLVLSATGRPILVGSVKQGGTYQAAAVRFGGTAPSPVANAKVTYNLVHANAPVRPGETVTLDGSGSSDPDPNAKLSYQWDTNGDGTFDATGPIATITPTATGNDTAVLKVTDTNGLSSTTSVSFTVAANIPPQLHFVQITPTAPIAGQPVNFQALASDDGTIVDYKWLLFPNGSPENVDSSSNTATTTFPSAGLYHYIVTVTDDEGATASVTGSFSVGEPPCAASGAVTLSSRVAVQAVTPTGDATCLHVAQTTGSTSVTSHGEIMVDGIHITPADGGEVTITSTTKAGKTTIKLVSASATVSATAGNAPVTFYTGALNWDLSGTTISGFNLMPGATISGMSLVPPSGKATPPVVTLGTNKTATVPLIPHLPSDISPSGQSPSQPSMVEFANGENGVITQSNTAHAADDSSACGSNSSNIPADAFNFCVTDIDLGVFKVEYLHVYFIPQPDGDKIWGAEAGVEFTLEGEDHASGGIEFDSVAGQGLSLHAAYLNASGSPALVDTGFVQLKKIAFQINLGPDFASTYLTGAQIPLPDGALSTNGTCIPRIGPYNQFTDQPYSTWQAQKAAGQEDLSHGIGPLFTLFNHYTIDGQPLGTFFQQKYPNGILEDPRYFDYGTPKYALCGELSLSLLELVNLDVRFGTASYAPQPAFPSGDGVTFFDGTGNIADLVGVSVGGQIWSDGYVDLFAHINTGIQDLITLQVQLELEAWKGLFNADAQGEVQIPILGLDEGAEVLASNKGLAACLKLSFFGAKWSPGAYYNWSTKAFNATFSGCDVAPYRVYIGHPQIAGDVQTQAHAAAVVPTADAPAKYVVKPGEPGFAIDVTGSGAPPQVTVTSPTGATFTTSGTAPSLTPSGLVAYNPATDHTEIAIPNPATGTWSVAPADGSAPITQVAFGDGIPEPTLQTQVTGTGQNRMLHYTVSGLGQGDTVDLSEAGKGGSLIGTVKPVLATTAAVSTKGLTDKGTMPFHPGIGQAGPRQLQAMVLDANGYPRAMIDGGTYNAPAPPVPAPVTALTAAPAADGQLAVTWNQPKSSYPASNYSGVVSLSDGRVIGVDASKPGLMIPDVPSGTTATVSVAGVTQYGRPAPMRTTTRKILRKTKSTKRKSKTKRTKRRRP